MKILRFFTVIVCIFIILSLFGCGKINIRPLLDKLPHDKIQLDNVLIEGVADAVATTAEGKTTEAVEYGGFNIVTAEIETEAVITEAMRSCGFRASSVPRQKENRSSGRSPWVT